MKKLCSVLAMLFILPTMVATPAGAKEPLRGEMTLYFNEGFSPIATECPANITWAGTITLDEVTYGMAFFPTGARETGRAFDSEETALQHLRFLKRRQIQHLERDLKLAEAFLEAEDLESNGYDGDLIPGTGDLVRFYYQFD